VCTWWNHSINARTHEPAREEDVIVIVVGHSLSESQAPTAARRALLAGYQTRRLGRDALRQ